jgi:predicted esterase
MNEHHIHTSRTARFVTLGDLSGPIRDVWFVCHGYGHTAAGFMEEFAVLDNGYRLLVAPEALSRFYLDDGAFHPSESKVGASWMTRADRLNEIEDYVNYLDALYAHIFDSVDRSRVKVSILGFSQGAATAGRWFVRGGPEAERLIIWAGGIAPDLDFERFKERMGSTELLLVYGSHDGLVTRDMVSREKAMLERHEIACRVVRFDGGHQLDRELLKKIAGE